MPAKKKRSRPPFSQMSKKLTKLERRVTARVDGTGGKRYVHWLCAPGNVCIPTEEPAFTESLQWRIFRIMAEFVEGFEFLSKLKKEVTIFGSARAVSGTPYYRLARELGRQLGRRGYTIISGGGPGIMEAANRGACDVGAESIGLNIQLPIEQRTNRYVKRGMGFHYFFTRKVMLSASAQAYVFFPGGFGTLDEMTEMVTLVQTGKIPRNVPVILFGRTYWQPFLEWVRTAMCTGHQFVEEEEVEMLQLVDTVQEAIKIIEKTAEREFG